MEKEKKKENEECNLSDHKDIHRMKQDMMLKRVADYRKMNPVFEKINYFFSLFF